MKLQNKSEAFILNYSGREISIPEGVFTVNDENVGRHILFISNKWKKDVKNITVVSAKEIEVETEEVKPKIKEVETEEVKPKIKEVETEEVKPKVKEIKKEEVKK